MLMRQQIETKPGLNVFYCGVYNHRNSLPGKSDLLFKAVGKTAFTSLFTPMWLQY